MLPQSWLLNIVSVLFNIPIMWAESFLGILKCPATEVNQWVKMQ